MNDKCEICGEGHEVYNLGDLLHYVRIAKVNGVHYLEVRDDENLVLCDFKINACPFCGHMLKND